MRRPLCAALSAFLAVYLAISLGRCSEEKNAWEDWADSTVQLVGTAGDFYEPADGSQENISFLLSDIALLSDTESSLLGESAPSDEDSGIFPKNSTVLCKLKNGEKLPRAGSRVLVSGTVQPFLTATNPGEFDAAAYYETQGTLFSLRNVSVQKQSAEYDKTAQLLYELRFGTAVWYRQILGEENGAIASAMVLGIKKDMDAQIKALYQDAGIAHVLAISGLHITFLGMMVFGLLQKMRLPLWPNAAVSVTFLYFYGSMTGFGVSTKRAFVMFVLLLAARLKKRTPDTLTSLAVAAAVILLPNPKQLLNSGFQLSFLAVTGAALAVPMLKDKGIGGMQRPKGRGRAWRQKLEEGMLSSFGITLFMLPALLKHFYKWNPWSIAANLLVIPLMSVLLVLLLLLAAAGWLLGGLAGGMAFLRLLALPAQGIFFLYQKAVQLALWLPGSSLHTGSPSAVQLAVFCAGMGALILWGRKLPPKGRLVCSIALSAVFLVRLPGKLQITMLDVGQGECVYVETPGHHAYLLDAGSSSKSRTGQYQIIPFLKYSGVKSLECIFISHWDEDHMNALGDILEWAKRDRVKIGRVVLPDTALEDDALGALLSLIESYGVRAERIRAGQTMRDRELYVECLHPWQGEAVTDRNGSSLVLKLTYGRFRALFTGDLEQEGEALLVQRYPEEQLDCDLLDAGHHGSAGASAAAFLEAASPRAVLISCGRNNRYGHPAPEALARIGESGAQCYVTAQKGAVTVTVNKDRMKVRCFLE